MYLLIFEDIVIAVRSRLLFKVATYHLHVAFCFAGFQDLRGTGTILDVAYALCTSGTNALFHVDGPKEDKHFSSHLCESMKEGLAIACML